LKFGFYIYAYLTSEDLEFSIAVFWYFVSSP